jgi:excisionase family DNA binding protein
VAIEERILSVKEASCDYFQGKVSAREVYALAQRGKIRSFRVGRKILIRESALDEYVKGQERGQPAVRHAAASPGQLARRPRRTGTGLQVLDWPL